MEDKIIRAVTALDDELTFKLVRKALKRGVSCEEILNKLNIGVENVGQLYEETEYFVSDLIMAAFIYKEVLAMEEMRALFANKQEDKQNGSILACTVRGDIHDIGKNIFINVAKAKGFHVYDMGIDVHPNVILETIEKKKIDILAMSGTLISSIEYITETIDLLEAKGKRAAVKVITGGLIVNEGICQTVGADFASKDIDSSIEQCEKWIAEKYGL